MNTKPKPPQGHKRAKVLFAVQVVCECGWTSANWFGKGASKNAHGELRWHQDQHRIKGVDTRPVSG